MLTAHRRLALRGLTLEDGRIRGLMIEGKRTRYVVFGSYASGRVAALMLATNPALAALVAEQETARGMEEA